MPLSLVRSPDIATLWDACVTTYLDDIGDETGPGDFPSFLWLTNRNLRDRLLEHAYARGVQGWLGPPFALWWDLPQLFDIRAKSIGLLTRRRMVSRLAFEVGKRVGLTGLQQGGNTVVRGHMLDRVFSDLLPEGVTARMIETGAALYGGAGLCAVCHGANGEGSIGPDLADDEWVHSDGSYDAIVHQILEGVPADKSESGVPMPPKGGATLTDEQVRAVAAYVWSLRFKES